MDVGCFAGNSRSSNVHQFFVSSEEETVEVDVHSHFVMFNTDRYNDFLVLKQYLLNNEEVKAYSDHKRKLALKSDLSRNEYKKIKSFYVNSLIERARKNRAIY